MNKENPQHEVVNNTEVLEQFNMNLEDLKELDTLESPACVIGKFFFVST